MQEQVFFNIPYDRLLDDLTERILIATKQHSVENEPKPIENKDDLITRQETAKILGVTLPTLHTWTVRGKLTSYHIGTRVRYKRVEVMNALVKSKAK